MRRLTSSRSSKALSSSIATHNCSCTCRLAHRCHSSASCSSCTFGDASLARQELGWQPEVSFDQLVDLMVDADMHFSPYMIWDMICFDQDVTGALYSRREFPVSAVGKTFNDTDTIDQPALAHSSTPVPSAVQVPKIRALPAVWNTGIECR